MSKRNEVSSGLRKTRSGRNWIISRKMSEKRHFSLGFELPQGDNMEVGMKRKLIPPFWMLLAGAVSSIIMCILHYEMKNMLMILIGVLVIFYIIGCLFKKMLDIFEVQNEPPAEQKEIVAEDEQTEGMDEVSADVES